MKKTTETNPIAEAFVVDDLYIELMFLKEDTSLNKYEVEEGWKKANELDPTKKMAVYLKTAKWSLPENNCIPIILKEIKSRTAVAILVHDLSQRIIGNFTLNLTGKSKHLKIFEKDEEARNWLLKKVRKGYNPPPIQ